MVVSETLTERWHGTAGGYSNHGCRCQPCRDAAAAFQRKARERRAKTPAELIPHGANGYSNYDCRCEICLEGRREERGGLHPRPPAECGTNRGYHAHRYRGQDACSACLEAHAEYERERKAAS